MLRSKLISDYLEASLEQFRAEEVVPVDVHLYFAANRHLLIWRKGGEVISAKTLEKYRDRGLKRVWIHRDDWDAWNRYIQATQAPAEEPPLVQSEVALPVIEFAPLLEKPAEARTEEGANLVELMSQSEIDERRKAALVARAARDLLAETANVSDADALRGTMSHARDAVRDVMDSVLAEATQDLRGLIDQMWDVSSIDPEMDHAVNVASLSVLFAMAFGRIDPDLLSDIALAGLLHDVGLTQIPVQAAQVPWSQQKGRVAQLYARHVDEGLRLLDEIAPHLPARVRPLIQQHHEKFDGSGYPMQLQGFQVNDVAQLVGMADAVESMASGQWDGKRRTLLETLDCLEGLEKTRTFPEYFNPEVFAAVTRWVRNPGAISGKLKASEIVRSTTRDLMKKG